jgi:hypothetical protein
MSVAYLNAGLLSAIALKSYGLDQLSYDFRSDVFCHSHWY